MNPQPGNVGENWTLANADESIICIGDVYGVGTARVQVSGARIPCTNQARRIGRADWVKLTLQELRTGFYMWVLEPGVVQAGNTWQLEERLYPGVTITALNHCFYNEFNPDLAHRFTAMPELANFWKERFAKKLEQFARQQS